MKGVRGKLLFLAGAALASVAHAGQSDPLPWWWEYPVKAFSQPSESMLPTIRPISTFLAYKKPAAEVRRGDPIAFRKGKSTWVMRVVGLPGDRIAMVDGLVSLNGRLATYGEPAINTGPLGPSARSLATARQRTEQFEGEATPHLVLDLGTYPYDNVAPVTVAPGHVFVLGDNRDNASDSRISAGNYGAGQVAVGDIYGVVDLDSIRWSPPSAERPRNAADAKTTVIVPSEEAPSP